MSHLPEIYNPHHQGLPFDNLYDVIHTKRTQPLTLVNLTTLFTCCVEVPIAITRNLSVRPLL